MNKKRFSFGAVSPNAAMIMDDGKGMDVGEVVILLNEQDNKIRQLLEENTELRELVEVLFKWA